MILKKNVTGECLDGISLKRMTAEEAFSDSLGALPADENITFKLRLPRKVGALGAVLRLALNGEDDVDYAFSLSSQSYSDEEYTLTLKLSRGLYFYPTFLRRKTSLARALPFHGISGYRYRLRPSMVRFVAARKTAITMPAANPQTSNSAVRISSRMRRYLNA